MIVGHIGGAGSPYEIQKSLRFRASASAYLSRIFGAGSTQKATLSGWVKRGTLGTTQILLSVGQSSVADDMIGFTSNNELIVSFNNGATAYSVTTSAIFRDPSAWYHVVVSVDTTQATATNRTVIYINGIAQSYVGTNVPQNYNFTGLNTVKTHYIGRYYTGSSHLDGYLSEINFIDGQALDPSNFGQVSAETGAWIPKKYTGTYGTNGFYLPFNDGSTLANLTADRSGNGNNWTANNFSLTPGVTYDWMDDTPTNNFAVLNPLDKNGSDGATSSANLFFASGTPQASIPATIYTLSGKWYAEFVATVVNNVTGFGVGSTQSNAAFFSDLTGGGFSYYADGRVLYNSGVVVTGLSTFTDGDVIGVALDMDAKSVAFYKNNVLVYTVSSGFVADAYTFFIGDGGVAAGINAYANFGQRPFAYSPPAGFKALCTKNLPTPSILNPKKHFDVVKRTGTGANRTITGVGFNPALVWIKPRNVVDHHILTDYIRGTQKQLYSNLTLAEETETTGNLIGFTSDGYTLAGAAASVRGATNVLNDNYVDWLWKAGGVPVTNNAGSIQSQVSANPQAGFSIVTYTGNGLTAATVGHGLGVVPRMVITKCRSSNAPGEWMVRHSSMTSKRNMILNQTLAESSSTTFSNGIIDDLTSSTVFGFFTHVTDVNNANRNGQTYVAYCFAEIPGYSKIGSYTGNGSADGPFVYCGFRPRYVMLKRTDAAGQSWLIEDSSRNPTNATGLDLVANGSDAEVNNAPVMDFVSNGFKLRNTYGGYNTNGGTYIFYAVAEQPFQFVNAR